MIQTIDKPQDNTSGPEATILLIEDNPGDARLFQEMLKDKGVFDRFVHRDRLSAGLTYLSENPVTVILLDLGLPDSQGMDTFLSLQRSHSHVPVIVLTGLMDNGLALSAVQNGAQDYLYKDRIDGELLYRSISYAVERKKAEMLLKNAAAEWVSTFDATADMICIIDRDHRIARINRSMAALVGRPPRECIGKHCYELVHGMTQPPDFCPHVKTMQSGTIHSWECYEPLVNKHVYITTNPLMADDGTLRGTVHVIHDITERKEAEKTLWESETRFRRIAEQSIVGISIAQDEVIKYANPKLAEMFGYSPDEFLNIPLSQIVHPDDLPVVRENVTERVKRNITANHYEYRGVTKSGEIINIEVYGTSGVYENTPAAFATLLDITRRKQMEVELISYSEELENKVKERTREAEAANNAKSDFLANMSHELRTPLNSVIGFAEVLEDELLGELNQAQRENVQYILSSGKHLLGLVNDILDISKVEAGMSELEWEMVSLKQIISEALVMHREKAMLHDIALSSDIAPEADLAIEADSRKLKQIFFNLLSNAVKFTPDGGKVWITCARAADAAEVEITVHDTGIGIRSEDFPILFQEFSQIDSSYDKKYEGTGLGLALTKKLVEQHGGEIWVESDYGRGSRFTFSLPVKRPIIESKTEESRQHV